MFSTPLICSSNGVATVSAIVFGFAPGYVALTTMVGGTTSGYSLTGNLGQAIQPAMNKSTDSVPAKTGRSMKKSAKRFIRSTCLCYSSTGYLRGPRRSSLRRIREVLPIGLSEPSCHGYGNWLHLDTRVDPLNTIDDNEIVSGQARVDDSQATEHRPDVDFPIGDLMVFAHDENELFTQ